MTRKHDTDAPCAIIMIILLAVSAMVIAILPGCVSKQEGERDPSFWMRLPKGSPVEEIRVIGGMKSAVETLPNAQGPSSIDLGDDGVKTATAGSFAPEITDWAGKNSWILYLVGPAIAILGIYVAFKLKERLIGVAIGVVGVGLTLLPPVQEQAGWLMLIIASICGALGVAWVIVRSVNRRREKELGQGVAKELNKAIDPTNPNTQEHARAAAAILRGLNPDVNKAFVEAQK